MALFVFTKAIVEGKYINVFNNGDMIRDFTYIDDISEGVVRAIDKLATPKSDLNNRIDPATSNAPYRIFNVGNNEPIKLMDYIRTIETELGKEAMLNYEEMQSGDVPATISDSSEFEAWTGFKPSTTMQYGVQNFVNWYLAYYKNKF
jgi:UDP-glucuronate 4-epimerase